MTDRSGTRTPKQPPNEGRTPRCPSWCVEHQEVDQGTPDHHIIHWGQEREAAGCSVQLTRADSPPWVRPGAIEIMVNGDPYEAATVADLAGILSASVAESLRSKEDLVIRVIDLPDGMDVVVYREINVAAVSARLDEQDRMRALVRAGVR